MFTPPPSPRKPFIPSSYVEHDGPKKTPPSPSAVKRSIARRTGWTVIVVPLALMLITLSLRFITHSSPPDTVDSPPSFSWRNWTSCLSEWSPHIRSPHVRLRRQASSSSSSNAPSTESPSPTVTSSTATGSGAPQTLPTIPSAPPVLPTPFPRAFDTTLTRNFSSTTCYSFFVNMSSSSDFLTCRPFSLLLQSSSNFIEIQPNISLLNNVVWGTCNTTTGKEQCNSNMAGFAAQLEASCKQDLGDKNAFAVNSLRALKAFPLMSTTGCLADPSTNTYCYVKAVFSQNPSDLYFYQLPFGTKLPNTTAPSCSACTKTMMGLYAWALGNETKGDMSGLETTYLSAANLAVGKCGDGYAPVQVANANGAARSGNGIVLALILVAGLMAWSGLC